MRQELDTNFGGCFCSVPQKIIYDAMLPVVDGMKKGLCWEDIKQMKSKILRNTEPFLRTYPWRQPKPQQSQPSESQFQDGPTKNRLLLTIIFPSTTKPLGRPTLVQFFRASLRFELAHLRSSAADEQHLQVPIAW